MGSGKGSTQPQYQGLSRYGGPSVIDRGAPPDINKMIAGRQLADGEGASVTPGAVRSEGAPPLSAGYNSATNDLGFEALSAMASTLAGGLIGGPVGALAGVAEQLRDVTSASAVRDDVAAMDRALHSNRNTSLLGGDDDDDDDDESSGGASASETSDHGGIGGR